MYFGYYPQSNSDIMCKRQDNIVKKRDEDNNLCQVTCTYAAYTENNNDITILMLNLT